MCQLILSLIVGLCFAVLLPFKIETITKDFRLKIDFVSFHLTLSGFCLYFYCILLTSMVVEIIYRKIGKLFFTVFILHRRFQGCRTTFRLFRRVPPQLMPFDLLFLKLKFSSVLSTQLYQLVVWSWSYREVTVLPRIWV